MRKPSKKQIEKIRKIIDAETVTPPPERPPQPWILHGKVTPNGLRMIEQSGEIGEQEGHAAILLGLTPKELTKLAKQDRAVAFALVAGREKCLAPIFRSLQSEALAGNTEAGKFRLRVEGFRESGDATENIQINAQGSRINLIPPGTPYELAERIRKEAEADGQVTMPGSYKTSEEYMAAAGQTEIIDGRTPEKKSLTYVSKQNPSDDPPPMKDVTPGPNGKLPTLGSDEAATRSVPLTPQSGMSVSPSFNKTTPY